MAALSDSPVSIARFMQAMLPMILSQTYILWLVVSGQSSYFQALLMPAMEVWAIVLTSALFAPTLRMAGERLASSFATAGTLVLLLAFLLFAAIPAPASDGMADQPVFRMFALAEETLRMSTLRQGLIYIAIAFGMSTATALASRDFRRWWFANMVMQAGMILVALFATALAAMFIASWFADRGLPNLVPATVTTLFFCLTRLLLVYYYQTRMTPAEFDDLYIKFTDGRDVQQSAQ